MQLDDSPTSSSSSPDLLIISLDQLIEEQDEIINELKYKCKQLEKQVDTLKNVIKAKLDSHLHTIIDYI